MKILFLTIFTIVISASASHNLMDKLRTRGDDTPRWDNPPDDNSRQGDQDSEEHKGDPARPPRQPPVARVWTFAAPRNFPPLYVLDEETREVNGVGDDVIRAACRIAHQHCAFIYLKTFNLCWDSEAEWSVGLAGRAFDGCASTFHTFERDLVNGFSVLFGREPRSALYKRANDNLIGDDLKRDDNQLSVGFIQDWWLNQNCLERSGLHVNEELVAFYTDQSELMEALRTGEVRVAFGVEQEFDPDVFRLVDIGRDTHCAIGGNGVMVRKDNAELLSWLNPALEAVLRSSDYAKSCYLWEQIFGVDAHCIEQTADRPGDRED